MLHSLRHVQRQRHDGDHGIDTRGRRKETRVGDVGARQSKHFAISIAYGGRVVRAQPARSHLMRAE